MSAHRVALRSLGPQRQPEQQRVGLAIELSAVERDAMPADEQRHAEALARELRLLPARVERACPLRRGEAPAGPRDAKLRAAAVAGEGDLDRAAQGAGALDEGGDDALDAFPVRGER